MKTDTTNTHFRTPAEISAQAGPLWKRLAWMVGIWIASVSALGVVAYGIRLMIKP